MQIESNFKISYNFKFYVEFLKQEAAKCLLRLQWNNSQKKKTFLKFLFLFSHTTEAVYFLASWLLLA